MNLSIKGLVASSTLVLGLSFSLPAFAEENTAPTEPERFYDSEFDAEITAYENTENGLVPLTEEEYRSFTEEREVEEPDLEYPDTDEFNLSNPVISGDFKTQDYREYWKYSETKVTTYTGNPIQASSTIKCNTSGGCSVSKNISVTVSSSFSVNTQAEKKAIKAGVSYTWVNSATSSSTYTFKLKKGENGYIAFKPTKRKSTGKLKRYSNWDGYLYSKSAYCRNPVKLSNGEAKGTYVFVHKK
ncbi:hypothetical protein P8881_05225 [Bacillus haynesii]|uniref:DUF6060 domain-containing protein n=1 Tax=Bacillus haynesii TaxID=1925021 RepID=UPI00227FFF71|nr:hypothetical protein [Bacillus haynesii]MCY8102240.1 hypothetical protein [Bacillus haynesii]MCY8470957.1 hypothetical protein [Bacillus haynesii]MCY8758824.1 hypothetical protein [Bacillus haynesii]MEC0706953.1 hypothetical protein [Bacillus haynesii]MEC0735483.1 hypothetical protein [Bacillus haynesii]